MKGMNDDQHPRVPGPSEIMLMLTYWRSRGETWAEEAHEALVCRYPRLGPDRDTSGALLFHDDATLAALHRAEAAAIDAARTAWRAGGQEGAAG